MALLTPLDGDTGTRLRMDLDDEDMAKYDAHGRGLGFIGVVTDRTTGQRWRLYGASCEQPTCYCDVRAVPEPIVS